jgi:acetoin utilization protein AcuC
MASFIYSDKLAAYDFGPEHPLKSGRLAMTFELLSSLGAFDHPESRLLEAGPASEEDVLLAHDPAYLDAVRKLSRGESVPSMHRFGFGVGDNPPFPGMYEASLLYTGASVQAARLISSAEERVAFNISGGLHHAMPGRASGFCIFNDPVVAIHRLLETFEKVAYVDIDAHHGDGVQAAFYSSRRVLTASIHESGRYLFPGTGYAEEIGEGEALGYSINAPLAPHSGDRELLRVFREAVLPVMLAFDPEVIVAQLGCDGHFRDPLAHLSYTTAGWLEVVRQILGLGKPVVALGGGGYDPTVVCRMWTLAWGAMTGQEFPDEIPQEFSRRHGVRRLRDGDAPKPSIAAAQEAERAAGQTIESIRDLVFPHWPRL